MLVENGLLILAFVIAALLVALLTKPTKQLVGGFIVKDKRGRWTLVLTPTPRPKKRRKRRR